MNKVKLADSVMQGLKKNKPILYWFMFAMNYVLFFAILYGLYRWLW